MEKLGEHVGRAIGSPAAIILGLFILVFLITVAIGLGAEFVYLVFVDPFGVIFWLVVLFVFVVLPFGIIATIVEKIRQ
jgi:hypothetical protein